MHWTRIEPHKPKYLWRVHVARIMEMKHRTVLRYTDSRAKRSGTLNYWYKVHALRFYTLSQSFLTNIMNMQFCIHGTRVQDFVYYKELVDLNFLPRNLWGPPLLNATSIALSVHALSAQRSAQWAYMQRINQCMIDLHWFNTHELKIWMC